IRRRRAYLNHILEKKSSARKRRLARDVGVAKGDAQAIKRGLGI
ncbi:MAG: 50S ribosomal protein L35, partial [Actinobacteria bacterium]|nr:50S ribosomal protein L35 [Actinomycetota bacterium]